MRITPTIDIPNALYKYDGLPELPMPPSANKLYKTIGERRAKSADYGLYLTRMHGWSVMNYRELGQARILVDELKVYQGSYLWLHRIFCFPLKKVVMQHDSENPNGRKKGDPKRLDVTNRIKAFDDALCSLLHVDDSWVQGGSEELVAIKNGEEEFVQVTIYLVE